MATSNVLEELSALEELAKAATPGPWCIHPNGTSVWAGPDWAMVNEQPESPMVAKAPSGAVSTIERELADCEFIAAANPTVVLALAEIASAALRKERAETARRDAGAGLAGPAPTEQERSRMVCELARSQEQLTSALAKLGAALPPERGTP